MIRHDGTQAKAKERTHTGKEEEEEEASHSTTPQLTSLPPSFPWAAVAAAILLCGVGPSVRLGAREPMSQKRSFPLSSFLCHQRLFQTEVRGEGDHTKQNSLFCSCSSYSSSLSLSSHRPSPPPPLCVVPARQWWDGGGRFLEVIIRPHRVNCCCPKGGKNGV